MANTTDRQLYRLIREHLQTMMMRIDNLVSEAEQRGELDEETIRAFATWKKKLLVWRREIDDDMSGKGR